MKKRQVAIIALSLTILLAALLLSGYFVSLKEKPKERIKPDVKKYVLTQPVVYEDVKTNVVAYGRVETSQSLDLLSEVAGRMYQGNIRLKEGINFKKGTLIFYIDDEESVLNLNAQKSNFLRDIANILPDLKIDYPDNYQVWDQYFSSIDIEDDIPMLPNPRSEKEKTFLATKAIYSNYYSIKSAELRLKKHKYYAPFSGSIIEVNMESGAFVNPGVKIGRIIREGLNELKVSVETKDIPWILEGTEVQVYSDETDQYWTGKLLRISDFVNTSTQSVDVFIAIRGNENKVYDGQFLQAAIPSQIIKDGMIIPRNAIFNNNEVFVLQDTLLKVKEIEIVRLQKENVIFRGLEESADLVIEPLINAYNNQKAFKFENDDLKLRVEELQQQNTKF